jgi:hypothetical protein
MIAGIPSNGHVRSNPKEYSCGMVGGKHNIPTTDDCNFNSPLQIDIDFLECGYAQFNPCFLDYSKNIEKPPRK